MAKGHSVPSVGVVRDAHITNARGIGKTLDACSNKDIGTYGEDLACAYLAESGIELVERNWRCVFGEADIIARDGNTLVLCEVKTRVTGADGTLVEPEAAVDYRKRARYERLALMYVAEHSLADSVRFDVIAIKLVDEHEAFVRHLEGAYEWDY